jgi:hypothetical protein
VKSILSRRPSPALAIACLALFLSLGGVSYGVATGFIDSREIRNNTIASADVRNNTLRTFDIRNNEVRGFDIRNSSIQGRDLAFNTLTGADISESSLGKVPAATQADSATDATTVGGMRVQKFFAKPAPGAATIEIFRAAGFAIEGGCGASGDAVLLIDQLAGTPATNVELVGTGDTATDAFVVHSASLGADLALVPGANASATGTVTLSTTSGAVTTIVYGAQASPAFAGEGVCALRGTVTSG